MFVAGFEEILVSWSHEIFALRIITLFISNNQYRCHFIDMRKAFESIGLTVMLENVLKIHLSTSFCEK